MAAGESRDPESDNTLSNQTDEDNDFEISEMAEDVTVSTVHNGF